MDFRKRIDESPIVVVLMAIVVGFTAGIGAYQGILKIAKLSTISIIKKEKYDEVIKKHEDILKENSILKKKLDDRISSDCPTIKYNNEVCCHKNMVNGIEAKDKIKLNIKETIRVTLLDINNKPLTTKMKIVRQSRDPDVIIGGFYELNNIIHDQETICIGIDEIGYKKFVLMPGFNHRFYYKKN
jgi:hypothetical protein